MFFNLRTWLASRILLPDAFMLVLPEEFLMVDIYCNGTNVTEMDEIVPEGDGKLSLTLNFDYKC